MDRRRVVARERIVGAEPDAPIEALERDVERRLGLARLAEPQVHASQPRVQFHKDAMPQRVLGPGEEVDLLFEMLERLAKASLQRRQVPGADVAAGDEEPFASRQERLLQLDGARGRAFAA